MTVREWFRVMRGELLRRELTDSLHKEASYSTMAVEYLGYLIDLSHSTPPMERLGRYYAVAEAVPEEEWRRIQAKVKVKAVDLVRTMVLLAAQAHPWPVVTADDPGIRPAGLPAQCFYCKAAVGEPHGGRCVIVQKTVKVRYIFELDLRVPHSWTKETIEFHRNDNTWCADNAIEELQALIKKVDFGDGVSAGECLCDRFTCEFVGVVDETPTVTPRG